MKKILLGILLGMLLHKSINYIYDYKFYENFSSNECKGIMFRPNGNLTQRFHCTHDQMGLWNYLQYLLIRPQALNKTDRELKWIF